MEQCEFCGASLPANASFCGKCGHVPQKVSTQATHAGSRPVLSLADDPDISNRPTMQLKSELNDNEATILSTSDKPPTPLPFSNENEATIISTSGKIPTPIPFSSGHGGFQPAIT